MSESECAYVRAELVRYLQGSERGSCSTAPARVRPSSCLPAQPALITPGPHYSPESRPGVTTHTLTYTQNKTNSHSVAACARGALVLACSCVDAACQQKASQRAPGTYSSAGLSSSCQLDVVSSLHAASLSLLLALSRVASALSRQCVSFDRGRCCSC